MFPKQVARAYKNNFILYLILGAFTVDKKKYFNFLIVQTPFDPFDANISKNPFV